ncbi:MAG: cytochrome c-type biogenesis protein CcmH [Xanthomonadales bacterium]|nr:cytochrome c-type biogenesis protein CcmH [Xanthomonadales bacterium]
MKRYWLMLCLLLLCGLSGAEEPLVFDSPAQEARFKALTEETRCLVCQNQSIADSNVPLAQDLRREVFLMLQAGQDDATIKNFLVERYGDFVLYRPPVRGNTLLLWLAPLLLMMGGAAVLAVTIKKRQVMLAADALASAREDAEPETRDPAP